MADRLPPPVVYPKNYKESTPRYKMCGVCDTLIPYDSKKCVSCGGEFEDVNKIDWTPEIVGGVFVVVVIITFIVGVFFGT